MPMLKALAERAGGFGAIERVAVTVGPGSFTGVRVGLAAARGLGLALGRPVAGASSLLVLAHRADGLLFNGRLGVVRQEAVLAAAIDARNGDVYLQVFGENVAEPLTEPALLTAANATRLLLERCDGQRVIAIGSGAHLIAQAPAAARLQLEVCLTTLQPHARQLAQLAPALSVAEPARPLYLRPPDAKPQGDKSLPRASAASP